MRGRLVKLTHHYHIALHTSCCTLMLGTDTSTQSLCICVPQLSIQNYSTGVQTKSHAVFEYIMGLSKNFLTPLTQHVRLSADMP